MAGTFRELVLAGVTTGTSAAFDAYAYTNFQIYVEFGAGSSAGVVTLESAARPNYAGTWKVEQTASWAAASAVVASAALVGRAIGAVRVRITTDIVGGTADVYLVMTGS